jgi:hypothetical protein
MREMLTIGVAIGRVGQTAATLHPVGGARVDLGAQWAFRER